jgi:hypothetical protein
MEWAKDRKHIEWAQAIRKPGLYRQITTLRRPSNQLRLVCWHLRLLLRRLLLLLLRRRRDRRLKARGLLRLLHSVLHVWRNAIVHLLKVHLLVLHVLVLHVLLLLLLLEILLLLPLLLLPLLLHRRQAPHLGLRFVA